MDNIPLEDKKMLVKGLLIGCPMGEALDTCPGFEYRKYSIGSRIIIVDTMADEKVEDILVQHNACMKQRQGELSGS